MNVQNIFRLYKFAFGNFLTHTRCKIVRFHHYQPIVPQVIFSSHDCNKQKLDASNSATVLNTYVKRHFRLYAASLSQESEISETEEKKSNSVVDPSKDRTKIIPPETSIRYMKSQAYKTTYGDEPIWVKYRRNFKGQFVPRKTRRTCIRKGVISTGNPCPICRDEYLVIHYTNVELLKQFISPYTGEMYGSRRIHVCQKKLLELEVAIKKAKFYGLLTYDVPFRKYNYKDYFPQWEE